MNYEGRVFRPPSEAYSLIVQLTIGCSHNKCTFCDMYKEKKFRLRKIDEVLKDFKEARKMYGRVDRIFLADGDALVAKTDDIVTVLKYIKEHFPECQRVTSYGSPVAILNKTPEELALFQSLGLQMIYLGLESGSDVVLTKVNKGETAEEIIRAGKMVKDAGMTLSVTVISGLGGTELWEEHAIETGKALSAMKPDYIGLLTLLFDLDTPLKRDYESGKFKTLTPMGIMEEMHMMISHMDCEGAVLRANHASNYVPIGGTLNAEKKQMLSRIEEALGGKVKFRNEAFRAR